MRIHRLDSASFLRQFREIAKIIWYHRDELFFIHDLAATDFKLFINTSLKTPNFMGIFIQYNIRERLDQFIFEDEIKQLDIQNLVENYSKASLEVHNPFIIHTDLSLFWSRLRVSLAKFKQIKCFDRNLVHNLEKLESGHVGIKDSGSLYKNSMDEIVTHLSPYLGDDWQITLVLLRGCFDGLSLAHPYCLNFKLSHYRQLPHDRLWADMSDRLLFASSIGLGISEKTTIYYPLTPGIQSNIGRLVAY